ncbi:CBS and ACT domain-containing protein [Clostridium sp. DL1XJH146]
MYIKNEMKKEIITVSPDTSIFIVLDLFQKHGYSQIPVVDSGKLVGLITEKILRDVTPSKATSLSIFEINYLLNKTSAKDVMEKDVITGDKEALLEEAAKIMRDKDIGSLPIIDKDGFLIGILTRTDIANAFIKIMGFDEPGTRITIEAEDHPGTLNSITTIIKDFNININSISIYDGNESKSEIILRFVSEDSDELISKIKDEGFNVTSVMNY